MSTMQEQMAAMLAAGSTAAGARIYPVTAPDNPVSPFLVYQRVSSVSENTMDTNTGLVNTRMQIDCYAETYSAAQALAAQVDVLMDAWSVPAISIQAQDLYEDAVKLFRVSSDYSIWSSS